jgi:hypothetical protein
MEVSSMKMKKVTALSLAAVLAMGTLGFSVTAYAADNKEPSITGYTVTIPKTLNLEPNSIGEDAKPMSIKVNVDALHDADTATGTLEIDAAATSTPKKKTLADPTKCFLINENDATAKIPYEWSFYDTFGDAEKFQPLSLKFGGDPGLPLKKEQEEKFNVLTITPTKPNPDDPNKPAVTVKPDELAVGVYKDVVSFTVSVGTTA